MVGVVEQSFRLLGERGVLAYDWIWWGGGVQRMLEWVKRGGEWRFEKPWFLKEHC